MESRPFEPLYRHVPAKQQERLLAFRAKHPRQEAELAGITWNYLLGGQDGEPLLLLPGGERIGDVGFALMEH